MGDKHLGTQLIMEMMAQSMPLDPCCAGSRVRREFVKVVGREYLK